MRRIGTVLVIALIVLAGVALPAVGVGAVSAAADDTSVWAQTETPNGTDNETGETEVAPGTRLAGSVGVQGAELGGELEIRTFDYQVNRSPSNESKAAVVARQTNQSQARLVALRAESERLEAAHENGTISDSEYRVRTAQLSARAATVRRVTDRTSTTASTLPTAALERGGVNVTALRTLRSGADELTGPEVATIARDVAGPNVGVGFGPDREANERGPDRGEDSPDRRGADGDADRPAGGQNETATGNGGQDGARGGQGNERAADGGSGNAIGAATGDDRATVGTVSRDDDSGTPG